MLQQRTESLRCEDARHVRLPVGAEGLVVAPLLQLSQNGRNATLCGLSSRLLQGGILDLGGTHSFANKSRQHRGTVL